MRKSRELRQELGELVKQSRDVLDKAEKEKRAMTAEETANMAKLDERMTALELEITTLEKQEAREDAMGSVDDPENRRATRELPTTDHAQALAVREAREKRYGPVLADALEDLATREDRKAFSTPEYKKEFRARLKWPETSASERRAISFGVAAEGGNLVPDEQFIAELIKAADNQVPISQYATQFYTPTAKSLGAPALATDVDDADWTTELEVGDEDTGMTLGKRELHAYPVAKYILVSRKAIRAASPMGLESLVRGRLAYKLGVTKEKAFVTGTGSAQPLGLWTESADGIPGSGNGKVDVGNGSGALDPDDFITARYSLKEAYAPRARWLLHRNWLAAIRKLKSSATGIYHWQPGLSVGAPPLFLDFPYTMDEYAPSTVATSNYGPILGDLSFYWINNALSMEIQVVDQLKALTNQVVYIIRGEVDAMPVLAEAFVRTYFTS